LYHHNRLLRAGINPAPTTSRLIDLVGAGFTPAHSTSDQKKGTSSQKGDLILFDKIDKNDINDEFDKSRNHQVFSVWYLVFSLTNEFWHFLSY
jgi:hypothetical protein